MDRTVRVVLAFAAAGILVRLLHLVVLFDPRFMTYFWIAWITGLVAALVLDRSVRGSGDPKLTRAASSLDHRARLNDEVLSAWWFLTQEDSGPWVDLHIGKAAEKARSLDVGGLFPVRVPSKTGFALGGLGAMVVLQFVPLPFVPNLLLSTPPPDLAAPQDRDEELDEIERLQREARELNPETNLAADASIDEFERLVESMRDGDLSLADTEAQADAVDALVDEGNLNMNSLLEGLEQMGEDLRRAEETAAAGEALSRGNLDAAVEEFQSLAQELAASDPVSESLQEALDQAAENARAGLEELAEALEQAAESLRNQDSASASEAMMDAAQSIDDLSDLVESQQLQNQAAQQMDDLRDAVRQQENAAGETPPSAGTSPESANAEPGEGEPAGDGSAAQSGQSGQGDGAMPPDALQSGAGQGENPTSGEPTDGESPQGAVPSTTGNTQGLDPSGTGEIPTGLGFSPDQKTGEATSLDVQLEMESTVAAAGETAERREPEDVREEATRQERSRLDYRSVPTDLSPAQQELLNEERIPREYRNVIRDYFQAIRPRTGEEAETGRSAPDAGPQE
jgi:hypothetical protein